MTILRDISFLWSMFHVIGIFLLLFEPRYSWRRTLTVSFAATVILVLFNIALGAAIGLEHIMSVAFFTCTLPTLALFFLLSRYRDGRFFFTFCLSDTTCFWLLQLTNLLDRTCGDTYILLFFSRLLLFPLFEFFLWKKLRRPYLKLQAALPGGWWTFTAVAAVYYLLIMVTCVPVGAAMPGRLDIIRLLLVMALMPLTYLTILSALSRQILYYETKESRNLLAAQVAGLQSRMSATQVAEETIRIERHDLRHKLLTVEDMIRRDGKDEALAYIHTLQGEVAYAQPERWCADPLLDAVFSSYFAQAKQQGIRVKANLSLPDELPVDPAELSTVFANALENAIRAASNLPPEQREIICTCISHPTLMFEIANPYQGSVNFDKAGLPVSHKRGHGIGTRSIAAFCKKHDACCVYEVKNGWFHLKIAL